MLEPEIVIRNSEVHDAVSSRKAVVALESSVIAQGLPRPTNFKAALEVEAAVREVGAVPATLAVLDGQVHVGLTQAEIERLAFTDGIEKGGARDLGYAITCRRTMATTVGASVLIAQAAGIDVFATGGVGGVHRGSADTGDVSNDLESLTRASVVTVSAGFKSILDLPRTRELLETLGILVVGYKTTSLPDFYGIDSGFAVPRVENPADVASILSNQRRLGHSSGILVVNPPPLELALERAELNALVSNALASAEAHGVHGKEVTPYLLNHMAESSGGKTVALNVALLVSNARVAANIAIAVTQAARDAK